MSTSIRFLFTSRHIALATAGFLIFAPGCSDEGETTSGTTTNGGSAGSGGTTASGGTGGSGGSTATGGTGGAASTCLPASATSSLFTIVADDLCAIAVYTGDGSVAYQQPTWGAHGGPLLVSQGPADGQVTLARWTPPKGADGTFTIATTTVDAKIPTGAFAAAEALDLGFRNGTAIAYSGAFPDTAGELIIVDGTSTTERYPVNGLFSMMVLPASNATGRIAYTGLSPLGDSAAGYSALYAADDCAGGFLPKGDPSCKDPIQVAAWGDASGPTATDTQGNAFVVMTNFAGDQEGRAFAAEKIAKGAAAGNGDTLFTLDGFGQSIAAIAPAGGTPGIVAFQPSDAMTFEALDVQEIRYTVQNGAVTAKAQPTALLTFATPNTPVAMITDPDDHLWVGVPVTAGDTTTTTFVVLARKP